MFANGEFDFNVIKQCLEHLGPDRFRLSFVAKEIAEDLPHKEKWYGTEYSSEPLSDSLIQVTSPASLLIVVDHSKYANHP
jgi:insulysin